MSGLVPRLRFPEFSGEWHPTSVGEFFTSGEKSEKATSFENDKILTVKLHGNGVVRNERTGTLTGGTNYQKRKAGQFIFSKIDLLNGAFGVVPDELDGFYSSTDVPALTFSPNHSAEFFLSWLKENYRRLRIERTGTSATLKRVAPDTFKAVSLAAPTLPEQRKIAECLTSLDELIAAEGQRLDALRKWKKALLQNLFPRERETTPRLRFPEFRSVEEWEVRRLEEVAAFVSDRMPLSELDKADYVSTETILPDFAGVGPTKSFPPYGSATRFQPKDVLISNIRPYLRKVWQATRSGGASNDVIVVRAKARLDPDYLPLVLRNDTFIDYVMAGAKGVKMPRGDINLMRAFPVAFPSEAEQHRIASCLHSLDTLITEQAKKLDTLKTHKQGLMQGLFPGGQV